MAESNHTIKTCRSGENCKHPDGPTLPISEFYGTSRGIGTQSQCKACAKAYHNSHSQQRTRRREQIVHLGEQLAVNKLRSVGVYATSGKSSEYRWVDIVAWGCVRIEVKFSTANEKGQYSFAFVSQRNNGMKADLIMLICAKGAEYSFHILRPDNPVFYRNNDGMLKGHMSYDPYQIRPKGNYGQSLTRDLMEEHRDRWDLIEEARLRIQQQILSGELDPKELYAPQSDIEQLSMWE